jgi:hypothetical protein
LKRNRTIKQVLHWGSWRWRVDHRAAAFVILPAFAFGGRYKLAKNAAKLVTFIAVSAVRRLREFQVLDFQFLILLRQTSAESGTGRIRQRLVSSREGTSRREKMQKTLLSVDRRNVPTARECAQFWGIGPPDVDESR